MIDFENMPEGKDGATFVIPESLRARNRNERGVCSLEIVNA